MFGLGATASKAAVLQADPVLAATVGHDEKTGVSPATYRAPKELTQNTAAMQTAWPPKGVTWPVSPIVSTEQLGGTGPALAPVT